MNKKKSKVLAFLLAASLLVPSANGIVSAAELKGMNNNTNLCTKDSAELYKNESKESNDTTGAVNGVASYNNQTFNTLKEAVEAANNDQTEGEKVVTLSEDVTLSSESEILVKKGKVTILSTNNSKIYLDGANSIKVIEDGYLKIEDLTMVINKSNMSCIQNQGAILDIEGCKVVAANGVTSNSNFVSGWKEGTFDPAKSEHKSKIILKNNDISINIRGLVSNVDNGSEIIGNTFDLIDEEFKGTGGGRTGVLTVVANDEGIVKISGNTFKNANRAIAVDNSNIKGENLIIKDNKFKNTRFAFEVGSKEEKNKGKNYDLSGNYFEHSEAGKGVALRIQDANSDGNNKFTYEDGTTELTLDNESKAEINLAVGPYYKTDQLDKNDMVHIGVATIDGVDYTTFEKAVKAANSKDGVQTIELKKDIKIEKNITLEDINIVGKDKKVVIDLIDYFRVGKNVKIENVELRANTDGMVMIHNNSNANLTIDNCKITAADSVKKVFNVVTDGAETVSLKLLNSEVYVNARNSFPSVGNGSIIKNNVFDLKGEKYGDSRTSILSVVGTADGSVEITGNTFKNANRGIAVDNSPMKGENIKIKDNIFKDVRFGFEIDPTKEINQNKNYDLSRNYFEFNGRVGRMRIQDASSGGNKFEYGDGSAELDLDKLSESGGASNLLLWPYYTDSKLEHLSNEPGKPIKPVYDHTSIIGFDRYDTAAKIADKLGSYDNVVLVNATSTMSDGLSASGLAGKENGAILLTKKDSIPKVTMDRLKKVKKVYIIGGENAISAKVANEITAARIKVERIGGKTRVETSELVAKKLGNYKKAFVVNGFKGEADAMSASAVAAKNGAPILLTNGKTSTHAKKSGVSYYVVGGNNVVNKSIANKYNAEVLAGDDRYETNREVINEFYGESETLYFANGETLVDALTASTLSKDDGLVLVGRKSDNKILNKKNTIQVGGIKFDVNFKK